MMRIAYICADPGVPVFGSKGCSVHVQEGVRALMCLGAKITLFARTTGGEAPADFRDILVYPLPPLPIEGTKERERAAFLGNDALTRLLGLHGPYDLIYERYSLWNYAGMAYAQDHFIPGILEVNAPLIDEQARHRELVHRSTAEMVARRVFNDAASLVAVSDEVATYLRTYTPENGRIIVVPNGVNLDRFKPRAPEGKKRFFTIGFIGTLKPWHGMMVLTEAFDLFRKQHADARLLIVGDGPEREAIAEDLAARECDHLAVVTGKVDPGRVPSLIATMDVAVAPYPRQEGFYFSPLKIFEYMACGVPVVASRIGQIPRYVEDGKTGLLCPPGDALAIARALERLYDDPALRQSLGRNACARMAENHSWTTIFSRILNHSGVLRDARPGRAGVVC